MSSSWASGRKLPGFRFPVLTSAADVEALPYLTDAEKQRAIAKIEELHADKDPYHRLWVDPDADSPGTGAPEQEALKRREPNVCMLHDPELFYLTYEGYETSLELLIGLTYDQLVTMISHGEEAVTDDPEIIRKHHLAIWAVAKVAFERKDEWWTRLIATRIDMRANPENYEKLAMLGFPESGVWDDEERTLLKLTKGLIDNDLSDATFDEAVALWGPNGVLRYWNWIYRYVGMCMLATLQYSDAMKRGEAGARW